ncbi:hypothetical protein CLIB1423_07S04456 [[Candida] railenensis]|uniref:Uncharacterized protein n=1 Tax=[Candida] railenensis TaxID=45579 RepID=A0A9P0QPQ9_9ASCO|nr:hypothetical protein CLIB1423_07S04456 [[Candida] railenensis]
MTEITEDDMKLEIHFCCCYALKGKIIASPSYCLYKSVPFYAYAATKICRGLVTMRFLFFFFFFNQYMRLKPCMHTLSSRNNLYFVMNAPFVCGFSKYLFISLYKYFLILIILMISSDTWPTPNSY